MIQENGLDADNQSEDSMRTIFCAEPDGSVRTKAEYLTAVNSGGNPERVMRERATAQVGGTAATFAGICHRRGVHANKQYHWRGRFIDTWIFKNKTWVCIAAQATLLEP